MANFKQSLLFKILKNLTKFFLDNFNTKRLLTFSFEYSTLMADLEPSRSTLFSRLNCWIFFNYTYLILYTVRFLATSLALSSRKLNNNMKIVSKSYLQYDLFIGYLLGLGFLDAYFAFVFAFVWLLYVYFDYMVHFKRGASTYVLVHHLVVANKKDFFKLNRSLNWYNLLVKMVTVPRLWSTLKLANSDEHLLFDYWALEGAFSIQKKAALFSMAADLVIASYLFIAGLSVFFVTVFYSKATIWPVYPFLGSGPIIFIEFALLWYNAWHGTKVMFFFLHAINLLLFVFKKQQTLVIGKLDWFLKQKVFKKNRLRNLVLPEKSMTILTFLQTVHFPFQVKIYANLDFMNSELVSPLLLATMLTFFGFHVYSITSLILKTDTLAPLAYSLLLIFSILIPTYFVIAVHPLTIMDGVLKKANQKLYSVQAYLSPRTSRNLTLFNHVRLHLKLTQAACQKFAFTVGYIGKITNKSVLEVSVGKNKK